MTPSGRSLARLAEHGIIGSANEKLYRQKLSAKDIIHGGKVKAPPSASELIALLNKRPGARLKL
jgi:lipid-binding SYLF domain-containing protein